jgi:hypothetical protein
VAHENGQQPDRLVVMINSINLESIIIMHIQQINDDAVPSILHQFEIVDQSGTAQGRGSLYGAPISVDITAHSQEVLKKKVKKSPRKKKCGSGKRRIQPVLHNINPNALIELNNIDNLCLFNSIDVLRARATMVQQRFSDYLVDNVSRTANVRAMLHQLNIPENLEEYSLEEYGEAVEGYINQKHPGKGFKLFGFDDTGFYKPYYSTSTELFKNPISVYLNDGHFNAICRINVFFGVRKYCFSCAKPYSNLNTHNNHCAILCKNCQSVDTTRSCSIPSIPEFEESCQECCKTFKNRYEITCNYMIYQ